MLKGIEEIQAQETFKSNLDDVSDVLVLLPFTRYIIITTINWISSFKEFCPKKF